MEGQGWDIRLREVDELETFKNVAFRVKRWPWIVWALWLTMMMMIPMLMIPSLLCIWRRFFYSQDHNIV